MNETWKPLLDRYLKHAMDSYGADSTLPLTGPAMSEQLRFLQSAALHLAKLPGVSIDIPDGSPLELGDAPATPGTSHNINGPSPQFALPLSIDPEAVLPQDHPFRMIRQSFDETLQALQGRAAVSRSEASKRCACRAAALARLLENCSPIRLLERLHLDLGLRWVVGLQPTDIAWAPDVLDDLLSGQDELVTLLCAAVDESTAHALKMATSKLAQA